MKKVLLYCVLVLALALTACSSTAPAAASNPVAVPVTGGSAASSSFPTGKFIKSGTTDYGLIFNRDGTFSVFNSGTTLVKGTYSVDGSVFTETSNDGGCKTNVSFTYKSDGKNLTFSYVGNPADDADCTGRNTDFNNVTYTLAK